MKGIIKKRGGYEKFYTYWDVSHAVWLFSRNGCFKGRTKDTSVIFPGSPREVIIAKIGPPETSTFNENGERVDSYLIITGNAPSTGRAVAHAALDLLTPGIWEVVGAPMELGVGREEKGRWIITYDKNDKVKDIREIKRPAEEEIKK